MGKIISKNSTNYIAMTSLFTHGNPILGDIDSNVDYYSLIGPFLGFQRIYSSNFNVGLELGLEYGFDNQDSASSQIVNFKRY